MKKILLLVGLFSTINLTNSPKAQAFDFGFSDLDNDIEIGIGAGTGTLSANGTFRISDTAVSSGILSQADFLDWEINILNSSTGFTTTMYGDGGGFGTDNSNIVNFPNGISVDSSSLDFSTISSGFFCVSDNGICDSNRGILAADSSVVDLLDTNSNGLASPPSLNATAVAVPFGVSPNLGILILGGMFAGSSYIKHKKRTNIIHE